MIEEEVTVGDDRQKVAIQVEKQDAENGATVAGAVFGIFNKSGYQGGWKSNRESRHTVAGNDF